MSKPEATVPRKKSREEPDSKGNPSKEIFFWVTQGSVITNHYTIHV